MQQCQPKIVGNDFGGTAGGPVRIPHFYNGTDKTFFYGTYEGFRLPSQTPYQASVPTVQMKQGNFSQVAGVQPLTNPFTGGFYPNFTVPVSPASQKFLQFFPDPNFGNTQTYTPGQINYETNQNTSTSSDQFDVRLDQYVGQKALVFGRFTWKNITTALPEPLAVENGTNTVDERIFVVAGNYNFSPRLLNEFRFGFTFDNEGTTNGFNGPGFVQSSGLSGLQNLFFNGVPELDFNFLTSLNADRLASTTKSRTFQYLDSLTWTKGGHTIKFGLDVRHIEAVTPLGFFGADNYGTFHFNTGRNFTGQEFGDFLVGVPQQTYYDTVTSDNDGITLHYNFYAQDEWKISPRLNLFYGLRYEYHPAYHDPSGNIGNFDPSVPRSGRVVYPDGAAANLASGFLASFNDCGIGQTTGVAPANGAPCTPVVDNSQAGLPSSLKTVPTLRFMPRFGFAFRPFGDDRTAIRGGFGMYNITLLGANFYSLTGTLQASTVEYNNSETTQGPAYAFPQIYAGQGAGSSPFGSAYFGTANDTNWKDPYSEQYSLSVDHEFGSGYGLRLSYIGLETHHLVWAPDLNNFPYSNTVSAANQPLSARPSPTGASSTGAPPERTRATTPCRSKGCTGLPPDSHLTAATLSPKTWPTIKDPQTMGLLAKMAGRARRTQAGPRSITDRCTAHDGTAGVRRPCGSYQ